MTQRRWSAKRDEMGEKTERGEHSLHAWGNKQTYSKGQRDSVVITKFNGNLSRQVHMDYPVRSGFNSVKTEADPLVAEQ